MLASPEVTLVCCIVIFLSVYSYARLSIEGNTCLLFLSYCVTECPEGYVVEQGDCSKTYWKSQKSCDSPDQQLVPYTCGFSRCDCPDSAVMDTTTGFCYEIDDCPKIHDQPTLLRDLMTGSIQDTEKS
ncbi:hypothetical protein NE865_00080 [Phthorimaea operculella]|nr:hypothetical protein NE865_00080 [Phthorimaea operculella]